MTHPPQRLIDAAKTVSDLKSRTGEPGTCDAELDVEIAGFHGVRAKMLAGLQLDSQPRRAPWPSRGGPFARSFLACGVSCSV